MEIIIKIAEEVKRLIKIILRTSTNDDGWSYVPNHLEKFIKNWAQKDPKLFELKQKDTLLIRLSDEGRIVSKYL